MDTINNNACDTGWITAEGLSAVVGGLNPSTTYFWQVRGHNSTGTTEADNGTWKSFTTSFSKPLNVAAAASGASASASSTFSGGFAPFGAINGDRRGSSWGNGGGWNDATVGTFPDWLEVDFAGTQTIDEVDVFSLQDNYTNPVDPVPGMLFTQYGIDEFQVQYWDGLSWVTVPGGTVISNNQVWRRVAFPALTTPRIRILITGAMGSYSRVAEVEAYAEIGAGSFPPGPLAKASPANAATLQPLTLTLNWGTSSGATSYEYCVDTINNNNCDANWTSTTNTSAAVGLSGGNTYFWQVRAINSDGIEYADSGNWSSFTTAFAGRVNVAAAANGGTASASSSYSAGYGPAGAINGDRKGVAWSNGGGWNDATAGTYPDWLQVDFAGPQTIDEIDVFTVQDNYANPVDPGLGMPFTLYGITAFQVQYWDGLSWTTVPGGNITGNNQVWQQIAFSPVTTPRIRVFVTGALSSYSRITEVEAYSGLHVAPGSFVKSSPPPAASGQASIPTLGWGTSSDATGYEYCIDTSDNNACDTGWTSTPSTSAVVSGLNTGTTYFWQVRARNGTGTTEADNGTWWSVHDFPHSCRECGLGCKRRYSDGFFVLQLRLCCRRSDRWRP